MSDKTTIINLRNRLRMCIHDVCPEGTDEGCLVCLDPQPPLEWQLEANQRRVRNLEALLKEAMHGLRHKECIDEDASRCAGCSLEARIEVELKRPLE